MVKTQLGSTPPKDSCNQWIECDTFSDPRNLFPSHKLKGNHTFTTGAATIGNDEGEADSCVRQEGEGEMETLADEEV